MLLATTKLEAINNILGAIGADPVNSLEDDTDVDVANALRMLDATSRNIQRKGWNFNRYAHTFRPDDTTHRIRWPPNILAYEFQGGIYTIKEGFLYDLNRQSFDFFSPLTATVTVALDFTDLPDCFRHYITLRTAADFQLQYLGDPNVAALLSAAVEEAHADLVDYDLHMEDYNMLQLTSIANVLERK